MMLQSCLADLQKKEMKRDEWWEDKLTPCAQDISKRSLIGWLGGRGGHFAGVKWNARCRAR